MYTAIDFKTKKALREAVANGEYVTIFQPGPFGNNEVRFGQFAVEGPHYPKPHTWYAMVTLENGQVTKVK